MKRKIRFIIRTPVLMFMLMCAVMLFKPTEVKAYNNGCSIVSPSTITNHYTDTPSYSSDGTWDEWKSWYASKGYAYTGSSKADGNNWWAHLSKNGTAYYAYLMLNSSGRYWAPYNRWICVNGVYYYTNESGIVLRNTWALIRINDDYYSPTDPYGYFCFDNSGAMCTGWHKASDSNWYYFRIDHANNKDGACIKVGESSGFCWSEDKKAPNSNSESRGIYHFTGINVTTNVYIMGTDGKYPTKIPDADKKLDFVKVDDIQPLSGVKTYKPNADFVKGKYEKIGYLSLNTGKSASLEATKNINIVNGDYTTYSIEAFNYYVDRSKYKQIVQVRYQKADGNWGDYSNVIDSDYYYGAEVSWSRDADDTYNAASIKYNVTEAATKKVNVTRKQYTQTINFYTYGASGTYNNPTYKSTYLNKKTYSSYYGTTFNAKSHGADYGNVAGYHWWKVDNDSWTVTGDASTNSFYYPNRYRISVDVAGGTGSNGNYDMEYGTTINLGTPSRTGWQFTGWTIIYDNSTNTTLSGNTLTIGYNKTYPYQDYMTEASVKIIANWKDITAPVSSDTILTATNPTKTITYATVTAAGKTAETPWVNNDVLLTFASKDNESGLSGLSIYERITTGIKAMTQKTLTGEPTAEVTYTDREEGTKTYYGKATDNAVTTSGSPANHETDTANLTVHIDKTAPRCLPVRGRKGTLDKGLTTKEPVVDTTNPDTGVITDVNELETKLALEILDIGAEVTASKDVSGIKKVTLVVYDSDYITQSNEDIYNNIYQKGTGKEALVNAHKYKEYDMSMVSGTESRNDAGAVYRADYESEANWYEDFNTSANLKYFIAAKDVAGNESMVTECDTAISNISIYAYITRNADYIEGVSNFLCGDTGVLHVVTYGYIDTLDIDFPSALLKGALLDRDRGMTEYALGTTQKDNSEKVEGAVLDPIITLSGGCQRNYDYPFSVPLYLADDSIGFLKKASSWTADNPVYDATEIVTIETGYKSIETNAGAQAEATAEAEATCFVGTNDSGQTKLSDKFHTHIIAPD